MTDIQSNDLHFTPVRNKLKIYYMTITNVSVPSIQKLAEVSTEITSAM